MVNKKKQKPVGNARCIRNPQDQTGLPLQERDASCISHTFKKKNGYKNLFFPIQNTKYKKKKKKKLYLKQFLWYGIFSYVQVSAAYEVLPQTWHRGSGFVPTSSG